MIKKNNFLSKKDRLIWQQGYSLINVFLVLIVIGLTITIIILIIRDHRVKNEEISIKLFANNEEVLEIYEKETVKLRWEGTLIEQCTLSWREKIFEQLQPSGEKEITEYLTVGTYNITITCDVIANQEKETVSDEVTIQVKPQIPVGWIKVPPTMVAGEIVEPFLVMKYEAKKCHVEDRVVSKPEETPWVNISQKEAGLECALIGGSLIEDLQWMAIAQDIASVDENWTGGEKGVGYISQGHSDGDPNQALAVINEDNKQKRGLKLSNNEIIWDFAGNVQEWTRDSIGENKMPEFDIGWIEYNQINDNDFIGEIQHIRPLEGNWGSQKGIGKLYVPDIMHDASHGFVRGGAWDFREKSGIFALNLGYASGHKSDKIGFRCVKPL